MDITPYNNSFQMVFGMNEVNVRIGHICKTNKDDVVLSEICSGDYNSNNIDRYKQSKWAAQLEQWQQTNFK